MGQTHRRHDVGEARRGGELRKRCSGCHSPRGLLLCAPGSEPNRLVAVAELEMAGNGAGDDHHGVRGSNIVGFDATPRGRISGLHLRTLRVLTNPTGTPTGPIGHRSFVGDEVVRRRTLDLDGNNGYGEN